MGFDVEGAFFAGVDIEAFLGYGVVVPAEKCGNFRDKLSLYSNEIVLVQDAYVFFGVKLTENDLNRAMLNSNLVQEWEHKTWVAFHRIFAANVEMPKPRFVFTTRYVGDII